MITTVPTRLVDFSAIFASDQATGARLGVRILVDARWVRVQRIGIPTSAIPEWEPAMRATVVPIPHAPRGAALARRAVERTCLAHATEPETADAVRLIASELVTNAVVHGAPPIILRVSTEAQGITIEVSDGDRRAEKVTVRSGDACTIGGRGLRMVASLAEQWGVRRTRSGKTVWARKFS